MDFTEIISWAISLIDMLGLRAFITAIFVIITASWGIRTLIRSLKE